MRYAAALVLMLVILQSFLFFSLSSVVGSDTDPVIINIPLCPPRVNASTGNPALVAGVYHNLSINIDHNFSSVNLSLSRGVSSVYFSYSQGNWSSSNGSEKLLDIPHCRAGSTDILFVAGLPYNVSTGDWNISVDVDGLFFYKGVLTVEPLYPHFSMTSPDFIFRVDPFSNEVLYPTVDTYKVRLFNPGNVPLEIHPEFESFDNMFMITNATGTLRPMDQRYLYLSFNVPSWSPRIIKTHGSVVGTPLFIIPTENGTANINASYKQTFNVEIDVVRQGYELLDLGDINVQYRKTLYADYNSEIGLDLFFVGKKDITLDISTESIRLDEIALENLTVSAPVSIHLTNTSEKHMHLSLNTSSPQITASVNYHVSTIDLSISKDFHTEVVVGPRPVRSFDSSFYINVIGISLFLTFLIALMGYVGVLYRKHRKEQDKKLGEEREKAIHRARKGAEKRVKVKRYTGQPPRSRKKADTSSKNSRSGKRR